MREESSDAARNDRTGPDEVAALAPVLSAALYDRFASRGEALFGDQLLWAMRSEFGGHTEKAPAA